MGFDTPVFFTLLCFQPFPNILFLIPKIVKAVISKIRDRVIPKTIPVFFLRTIIAVFGNYSFYRKQPNRASGFEVFSLVAIENTAKLTKT